MQTTGLEQVMHLLRQAMHLVQEQKPLRFEVVQFYQSLLCQRMSFRHECKQRFVAQRFASQRWTLLASGRQCDIQLSRFDPPSDAVGHVLDDFQCHLWIMFLECDDQFR